MSNEDDEDATNHIWLLRDELIQNARDGIKWDGLRLGMGICPLTPLTDSELTALKQRTNGTHIIAIDGKPTGIKLKWGDLGYFVLVGAS